jgi:hypothetical protein
LEFPYALLVKASPQNHGDYELEGPFPAFKVCVFPPIIGGVAALFEIAPQLDLLPGKIIVFGPGRH